MTAAHLILCWQENDDPNLLRHAARARDVGRNPRIVGYQSEYGPSASYYAWIAAGRPVHGIRAAVAMADGPARSVQVQGHPLRALHGAARKVLEDHDGLESANADFQGNVTLVYDDERTDRDALLTAMLRGGFREQSTRVAGIAASPDLV